VRDPHRAFDELLALQDIKLGEANAELAARCIERSAELGELADGRPSPWYIGRHAGPTLCSCDCRVNCPPHREFRPRDGVRIALDQEDLARIAVDDPQGDFRSEMM